MSRNTHTHKKVVERGLTIYKTGRSRFWHARLWDRRSNRYLTKSTGETDRRQATTAAREWKDQVLQSASGHLVNNPTSIYSFEYYARMLPKSAKDDWVLLSRATDGILAHFGNYDVRHVTTGSIRTYLELLNENRTKPLATSTVKKHIITIRKVLRYANENAVITNIPESPRLSASKGSPRPGFEPDEWLAFYEKLRQNKDRDDFSGEVFRIINFVVFSFIRPSKTELMGLRTKDVKVKPSNDGKKYLELKIQGKTGYRLAVTMPQAVSHFEKQVDALNLSPDDHLWFPKVVDRSYALRKFSSTFSSYLQRYEAEFTQDGQKRTAYSLRHFSLTARLISSGGQTNIYALAKNAGTSVKMLEEHYIKYLRPNQKMVENLQFMAD